MNPSQRNSLRILFMGTPDFAASCLSALIESGQNIVGCVTGEDRARGRGMKLTPTPVKEVALREEIPVYQPTTLRGEDFAELLEYLSPNLIIVAAYGKLLPENVLEFPKYGCVNAHASLLPKYRGAAPIQRAIMAGERETGVTAMFMEKGLDTGDMILTEKVDILPEDNFGAVHDKLCSAGGRAMVRVCEILRSGEKLTGEKQDDSLSTYASKITNEDLVLDFTKDSHMVVNTIRAFAPSPCARTRLPDGKLLKLVSAVSHERSVDAVCGEVTSVGKKSFTVACGTGEIEISSLIPEGKGQMCAADFINGRKIAVGDILGEKNN